jgi:AcrR family transcriptional regulator
LESKLEEKEVKERILHQAGEMFLQFGFSRVTMEEIAVELGMSKKTLYRFFPGKEQLLKEMVTGVRCKLEDYVEELWGNNEMAFLEKLKNLMNYISSQSTAFRGPLAHDLQKNFPQLWEEINESRKTHSLHKFNLLISAGIENGVFRKDIDQQIVVLLFMNVFQGILNSDVLSQLPYTANQVFDSIIRVLMEGIFTEEGRNKYLSIKHEENILSTTTNIKN